MADGDVMGRLQRMGGRRLALVGAAVAAIVAVALLGRWAATPAYVALYTDVDLADAGKMTDALGKGGVPFRLADGGTAVMVPAGEAARARVLLARDGLPGTGRPGLELFDRPTWGMTDFTQRVTYQRALEGELARTLGTMRGVERAQVHLLLPVSSPIRRLERPAGASVVLTLAPGSTLSPESVQGITFIVSNSVEQLSPDHVAVMDDAGRVLSAPSTGGPGGGLTSRQLEVQGALEARLVARVEDLIATVVGPGRARAEVAALMSFDQVDRTVETYDPDGQVIQSEQRSESGPAEAADAAGAQTIISNQYQNSRRVERTEGAAGTVTRLTVSVLVDEAALRARASAPGPEVLESMVRNAVGADSARGDRVAVLVVPFDTTSVVPLAETAAAPPAPEVSVIVERWSRPAVALVAVIALLVLLVQALRLVAAAPAAVPAAEGPAPVAAARHEGLPDRLQERLAPPTLDRPEAAARVLRAWLAENN